MKVVHICHSPAFATRFAVPMVDFLKTQGYQVELWLDSPEREVEILKLLPTYSKYIRSALSFNILTWPLKILGLIKNLKRSQADLVHCHSTKGSPLPLIAAKILGIKTRIYHNHGFPYMGHKGFLRLALILLEKINMSLATHTISVSPSNVEELLKDKLIKKKEDVIILHRGSALGIDLAKFPFCPLDSDNPTYLYIGRPFARKGFPLMVKAWNKSQLAKKGAKLLIAGCTRDELLALNQGSEGIEALGFVSPIEKLIRECDVIVLPSFHEGFPYAILEAQACGKAVIGSNVPGIEGAILDQVTGLLFECGNQDDLSKKIVDLFLNKDLRIKLGQEARKVIEQDFTNEKVLGALKSFYQNLEL